jgi:hypothetical protein
MTDQDETTIERRTERITTDAQRLADVRNQLSILLMVSVGYPDRVVLAEYLVGQIREIVNSLEAQ